MGDASGILISHCGCYPTRSEIEEIRSRFQLTKGQLLKIRDRMLSSLNEGLKNQPKSGSVSVIPTYVTHMPDGTEKGVFLALDLGGANFRVVKIDLPGVSGEDVQVHSQVYLIPRSIMVSTSEEFFDHIAKCIADFVKDHELQDQRLPLGFTFSFPCAQKGLNQSILLRWTKDFNVTGVVGKDIVKLLQDAIKRRNRNGAKCLVDVVAVINDTVGTLMSCAYEDTNCTIGMIVGTGTNACYMESAEEMKFMHDCNVKSNSQMCINTEWGAFGEDGSLDDVRTTFDHAVDASSTNPGVMLYEKMISGLYLGDVVHRILIHLITRNVLFNGKLTAEIRKQHCFPSSFVTQIERDEAESLPICDQIFNNLGYQSSVGERQIVKTVCSIVSTRAAELCASGVSALLERMRIGRNLNADDQLNITVAVDGTLYKKHPTFKHVLSTAVHQLSPNTEVTFSISKDGSGKGAALVSAVSCKLLEEADA